MNDKYIERIEVEAEFEGIQNVIVALIAQAGESSTIDTEFLRQLLKSVPGKKAERLKKIGSNIYN